MLSATGRKFLRGPRGTGFLWVRRELIEELEPPLLDLHAAEWLPDGGYRIRSDARRFENWETYYAGKIGLGVAADYALAIGLEAIAERVQALAATLREAARRASTGVEVRDRGLVLGGTVTFTVDGRTADEVKAALAAERINVSVSPASYARLQLADGGVPRLVRASVHYYNTDEELDRLVQVVADI